MSSDCAHLNSFDDLSTGDHVCPDCSYVINSSVFLDPFGSIIPPSQNGSEERQSKSLPELLCDNKETVLLNMSRTYIRSDKVELNKKKVTLKQKCKLKNGIDLIHTIGKRYNIIDDIITESVHIFKDMIKSNAKKGVRLKENIFAALAFYIACKTYDAPRSRAEVCLMFHIDLKTLNKLESHNFKHQSYIDTANPSIFLPRVHILNVAQIDYKIKKEIADTADRLVTEMCATPISVMGYVLFMFLNSPCFPSLCKNPEFKPKPKYSMTYVGELCRISPSCIRRILDQRGKISFSFERKREGNE